MVSLEKCCFCVPLKPGCLVVAYLNLIETTLAFIYSIAVLTAGAIFYGSDNAKEEQLGYSMICLGIVLVIILLVSLAFSIVLLVGLHKNKPGHVKTYLIFNLVIISFFVVRLLVYIIIGYALIGFFEQIIQLLISSYFFFVIRSYHMKMLKDTHHGHVQKA